MADEGLGEGSTRILRAALYDPQTDRLYLVTTGEKVGLHDVKQITETFVTLATGGRTATLSLKREPDRGGEGENR